MHLPDDLERAFKASKGARAFCDGLSYSYKKEYVDWIVTAKREATRAERVHGTVERLHKQWKKPRDL